MLKSYSNDDSIIEIGVDEAGRGPLFGRVYASAVILPSQPISDIKDSKKFSSKKKLTKVYGNIIDGSIAFGVSYMDEKEIDKTNILRATQECMHLSIRKVIDQLNISDYSKILLLIDGNYFVPFTYIDKNNVPHLIRHETVEKGDNTYLSIAAASILSKVERDKYIIDLCENKPDLKDKYDIHNNKGYGSKKHIEGIKLHGISDYHRKTFGICKSYA